MTKVNRRGFLAFLSGLFAAPKAIQLSFKGGTFTGLDDVAWHFPVHPNCRCITIHALDAKSIIEHQGYIAAAVADALRFAEPCTLKQSGLSAFPCNES